MRTSTPRATPLVTGPPATLSRPPPVVTAPELVGGALVVWRTAQHELTEGSLLIGRAPDCDILLDDPLVSRVHARVNVEAERVSIEDLHSTNGVYLRGERISRTASLHDGDRILVGTHEVSFFRASEPSRSRATSTWPEALRPETSSPLTRASDTKSPLAPPRDVPTTVRAAALEIVGSLAERFAAEGRLEEAANLVMPHLKRILRGAISGLEVSTELCGQATTYALDVASWIESPLWLDYVVELHLASKKLMTQSAIAELLAAEQVIGSLDELLLKYYVESFAARRASFSSDDRARLLLLERSLLRKR